MTELELRLPRIVITPGEVDVVTREKVELQDGDRVELTVSGPVEKRTDGSFVMSSLAFVEVLSVVRHG